MTPRLPALARTAFASRHRRRTLLVATIALGAWGLPGATATPLPVPLPLVAQAPIGIAVPQAGVGVVSPPTFRAGAVLTALDSTGRPLVSGDIEVFHAGLAGVQIPIADLPIGVGGQAQLPLPVPAAIPDQASNYYAVATGLSQRHHWAVGIEYFNLISERPLTQVAIHPNLFRTGSASASPSGPCGFNPDNPNPPPPPFFTITQQTDGVLGGTVDVGAAHGAGSFPDTWHPENLLGSSYKALGEQLDSEWARATESSVVVETTLGPDTQPVVGVAGNLHFTLATSDASSATSHLYTEQGGQGARGLVVGATWLHQHITFHCNYGDPESETHDVYQPHQWDPSVSTATPTVSSANDSLAALSQQTGAVVYPLSANQHNAFSSSESETYQNGGGFGIGAGPVGVDFSVYSQSTYSASHTLDYWSGGDCGPVDHPLCYLWAVPDSQVNSCDAELSCGSDFYAATLPTPTTVPNPEPQPCSKYEPHGACDP